jgi:voltage-gated potassium channel
MGIIAGLFLVGILLFMGSCIGVLWAEEQDPSSKLNTAENVLWWAVVTSSTVGYGELYPVTNAGRGFAVVLMVVGIGAFATLTSAFGVLVGRVRQSRVGGVGESSKRATTDAVDADRLDRIEVTMARLEAKIDALSSETRRPRDDPES